MEEREKVYRQRAQERAQREQAQSSSACQSKRTNETRRKKNRKNSAAPVVPGTTANFQMKISQVRAKREKESDDLRREKRKETARHVLEQVTSKRLAQVMARIDRQQGRLARRDTAEEAHERASESRARYRNALAENRQKLEQVRTCICHFAMRDRALNICFMWSTTKHSWQDVFSRQQKTKTTRAASRLPPCADVASRLNFV